MGLKLQHLGFTLSAVIIFARCDMALSYTEIFHKLISMCLSLISAHYQTLPEQEISAADGLASQGGH